MSNDEDEGFVLRIRGLPWSATKEEIENFFKGCTIKTNGIHMTLSREGRPSGEAYVEMASEEDFKKGLDKNNQHMGHRYIEVFKSKKSEMEWVIKRSGAHQQDSLNDGCIRLRGLPFGCSKEEIAQFFSGLEIVPNGISLPTDYQGRSTGEAYVQFASRAIAEKAMGKHKEKIGHRYIEIFKSSLQEIRSAFGAGPPRMRPSLGSNRPAPYDRNDRFGGPSNRYGGGRGNRNFRGFIDDGGYQGYGDIDYGNSGNFGGFGSSSGGGRGGQGGGRNNRFGGGGGGGGGMMGRSRDGYGNSGGHFVHMRGLPFRAVEQDIYDFFRPLNPINIRILYENNGRPSGEADVEFSTHEEAVKAMGKDKANIQHRYIELFLNSSPSPINCNMGFGGGMPNPMGGNGGKGHMMGFDRNMGNHMGGGDNFGGGRFGGVGGNGHFYGGPHDMGGNYDSHPMEGGMGSMIGGNNYTAF
ncbi:heterogeneous nuclear ribonucleoprotein F-like isoform X2 [Centruroides vittatus]|uniref:heterogeneous nuclear ribonucleoprotein F-like isoform X2 n=1 Tax=Centruroides vittatus TaxID=120091 RepID=UPI00350FD394